MAQTCFDLPQHFIINQKVIKCIFYDSRGAKNKAAINTAQKGIINRSEMQVVNEKINK